MPSEQHKPWKCPACGYALTHCVKVCPECGRSVEIQEIVPSPIVLVPRIACFWLALTLAIQVFVIAVLILTAGRRSVQEVQIASREAALQSATYNAMNWVTAGSPEDEKRKILFNPPSTPLSPLSAGAIEVMWSQKIITYPVTLLGLFGMLASTLLVFDVRGRAITRRRSSFLLVLVCTSLVTSSLAVVLWTLGTL